MLFRGWSKTPAVPRSREDHAGTYGALLHGLDQPMHLFAYLTGANHYHFGEFESAEDTLLQAQERLADTCADHFARRSRILDVGCGLGGTSLLLARRGHRVVGVDPCAPALELARASANGSGRLAFEDLPAGSAPIDRLLAGRTFDGMLFLEVLQYYPQLDSLLQDLGELSKPGTVLVFSDTFCEGPFATRGTPHHGVGDLSGALQRAGLQEVSRRPMTHAILPTLEVLRALLRERRDELIDFFRAGRPRIEREVAELREHCLHLATALENGDLVYNVVTARRVR